MPFNHFDYVPSGISHNRSVFKFSKAIATGAEIGFLYPMCKPVVMYPGSSLKLDLAMEVRSGALIAPLQDELIIDCYAFKVPNRIVWEHWKQFLGSVDDVLFDYLTDYQIPSFEYVWNDLNLSLPAFVASHSLATCMELPAVVRSDSANTNKQRVSALPFRGYNFIWNEFFRPEQLVDPVLFSKTDNGWSGQNMRYTNTAITLNGSTYNMIGPVAAAASDTGISGGCVLPTFRVHKSLWTSCLPKPSLETLNLLAGLSAPVGFISGQNATLSANYQAAAMTGSVIVTDKFAGINVPGLTGNPDVIADLNQALLTVNNYRETIMLQNYYDALNRAGSRYDEIIRNLFHVQTDNAVIDIPELIVHKRFTIYRKDVVATAETLEADDTVVKNIGSQAAYIDTVVRDSFFTTSTTEHGYVHMLYTIRPSRIRMAQGIEPDWFKFNKFDLYYSQFDGMGDVPRYKKEIFFPTSGTAGDLDSIFGYQEYGADDKYQRNSAVGWLDVNLSGHIPGFTLCEKLSAQPVLSTINLGYASYISCLVEEEAFARCLAISNPQIAPQFVLDIRLTGEIVHPMPVYNIPGMGDLL